MTYQGLFNIVFSESDIIQDTDYIEAAIKKHKLSIANMVLKRLEHSVIVVDEIQRMYSQSGRLNTYGLALSELVKRAKEYENCIFVSIHMNKFVSEKYSGLQVYYSDNIEGGRELAQNIQSFAKELLQKDNNRKIKKANSTIYVLDKAVVPSVLVECGFLSNAEETEKLCDKEYRRDIATMLFMAIDDYISSVSEENKTNK